VSRAFVSTRNTIGVRSVRHANVLGVYRGPAELPPRSAMDPVLLGRFFNGVGFVTRESLPEQLPPLPVAPIKSVTGSVLPTPVPSAPPIVSQTIRPPILQTPVASVPPTQNTPSGVGSIVGQTWQSPAGQFFTWNGASWIAGHLPAPAPTESQAPPLPTTPGQLQVGAQQTDKYGNTWTWTGSAWQESSSVSGQAVGTQQFVDGNTYTWTGSSWVLTSQTQPGLPAATPASAGGSQFYIGETYEDASGNIYTWNGSQWVLTTQGPTSTAIVPSTALPATSVTSGGGTPSVTVSTAPPPTSFMDQISAWLEGSTTLFGMNIPNWGLGAAGLGAFYLLTRKKK